MSRSSSIQVLSRFIIPLNWVPTYRDCAGCHTILTQVRKLLVGLVLLGFAGATPVLAAGEEGTPDPVDITILVDESASLSSAAVRSEKEAILKIINSIVVSREGIRLGILPFSSGEGSPRSVPECDLTETDSRGIENLTKCVNQVVRQQKRGQADTDFAQAIEMATSNFSNSNATKVIVLLTDGKYDPDGNESISPEEQETLDLVLQEAKGNKISLWALGFGKADIEALQSYIDQTFDGSESCSTKSVAVLAKGLDLSEKFEKIIDFATCTGHISGSANPNFDFSVSPLLSRINIEAIAATGSLGESSVVVKDANGEKVCNEPELVAGRWRCSETLTGENAGKWTLTDRTGKGLSVDATSTGEVYIEATDCKIEDGRTPEPKIRLTRADEKDVAFDIEGAKWPTVDYKVSRGEDDSFASGQIDLFSKESKILGSSEFAVGDKISLKFAADSDPSGQLLIRTVGIANCTLNTGPTTTTSSSTTTSVVPATTLPPDCNLTNSCPPPPPPIWPWVMGVLVLAAGAFFIWKKMGKKFPEDTELQFQSQVNRSIFLTAENISGQRKVYFTANVTSSGSFEVEMCASKADARYVMTRDGVEFIKIVSLLKPEISAEDENLDENPVSEMGEPLSVLNGEQFDVRSCDAPNTIGKSEQIILRVQWPEDEDL